MQRAGAAGRTERLLFECRCGRVHGPATARQRVVAVVGVRRMHEGRRGRLDTGRHRTQPRLVVVDRPRIVHDTARPTGRHVGRAGVAVGRRRHGVLLVRLGRHRRHGDTALMVVGVHRHRVEHVGSAIQVVLLDDVRRHVAAAHRRHVDATATHGGHIDATHGRRHVGRVLEHIVRRAGRHVVEHTERLQRLAFPSETTRTSPEGSLLEHELGGWVDRPVVSLARTTESLRQLDEALVQRQVVSHRVLPALVRSAEEGEPLLQELVDLAQCTPLCWCRLYGHDDEGDIGVRRLLLPSYLCPTRAACRLLWRSARLVISRLVVVFRRVLSLAVLLYHVRVPLHEKRRRRRRLHVPSRRRQLHPSRQKSSATTHSVVQASISMRNQQTVTCISHLTLHNTRKGISCVRFWPPQSRTNLFVAAPRSQALVSTVRLLLTRDGIRPSRHVGAGHISEIKTTASR